jgi:hypothetical protein
MFGKRGRQHGDFVLGGVLWAPSLEFQDENPRFDLHRLAMVDLYSSPEGIVWSLLELSSG